MKTHQSTPILLKTSTYLLSAWCATSAFGALSLTNIPPAGSDLSNEGRAITCDGQYVVGLSGANLGFLYPVGSSAAITILSSDNAQATVATGVGYRTSAGNSELIIAGMSAGYVTEWMTSDGGTSFGPKRRNTSFTSNVQPAANSLGATNGSDAYYVTSWVNGNGNPVYMGQGTGPWVATVNYQNKGITSTDTSRMNGMSASGRAVGYRVNGGIRKNYMLTWSGTTPAPVFFNGLDGTQAGEAFSVSADGNTVFGRSPATGGLTTSTLYGYRIVNPGGSQTINALPEFSDTGGSSSRACPYGCSAAGTYAVGMSYRGRESAVLWDTSNPDPSVWTVNDLHGLALANGTADIFTRLTRAYSVGTNSIGDPVITGIGTDGNYTRAFVMTVPRWVAAIGFPGNQTVMFGTDVTFSARTNGTDALSFQWYKDGSPLVGQTSTSISFTGVTCAGGQAGNYQLVVTNTAISAVVTGTVATLTVTDPYISSQPVSQNVVIGTNAIFTVTASGSAVLSYQWQRGGIDLTDGDTGWGSTVAGAKTATLTISNVQIADANTYNVVVSTGGGCPTSSAIRNLNVYARPMFLGITTDSLGNYTMTLDCTNVQPYRIFYSTNVALPLSSWKPLSTNTFPGYSISYIDYRTNDQGYYIISSP